jgi:hypothetical protein
VNLSLIGLLDPVSIFLSKTGRNLRKKEKVDVCIAPVV